MNSYDIKDSGKREQYSTGMVRDTQSGKTRYDLVFDGPMFERWAEHLTKGAEKYALRNWMQAATEDELDRFRASAVRHFIQWLKGDEDEDHAAAVFFNINGVEYVRERLSEDTAPDTEKEDFDELYWPTGCGCFKAPFPHYHRINGDMVPEKGVGL